MATSSVFGTPLYGAGVYGSGEDPVVPPAGPQPDPSQLRFIWQVLHAVDARQTFTWTVLEVTIVGGELRFQWRVIEDPPAQRFVWTVLPAALLELFESHGVGAAAGIAPDTLLPVGRATKD